MLVARGFTTLLALTLVGCFQTRPLDRRFDAAPPDADDPDPIDQGPDCATTDPTCDGVDDDCDGRYDEDFVGLDACGIGQCRATSAAARCVSGFPIDCLPGADAREACDGLDNDCDGATDEGLERACGMGEGLCVRGQARCEGGAWTACDGVGPVDEVCDGQDQDCDGEVDEGLTQGCGDANDCGGVDRCQDGAWTGCDGAGPTDESCNGVDDDCDGEVDEQLERPCGIPEGECSQGIQTCADGDWTPCDGAVEPVEEQCNDLDDDCDGVVDEGDSPCGICALESRPICAAGVEPCVGAPPMTLCVQELGHLDGAFAESLGRALAELGDVNGDGVADFAVLARRGVFALSGADGEEVWGRDDLLVDGRAMIAADIDDDDRREVILVDARDELGQVRVLRAGGNGLDTDNGHDGVRYRGPVAAVHGRASFAVGDPDAMDGAGVVRHFDFRLRDTIADDYDLTLPESVGFPRALFMARDGQGRPATVATTGAEDARQVLYLGNTFGGGAERSDTLFGPAPGVGEHLVMGPMLPDGTPLVAALDADQPWVDIAEPDLGQSVRLPLDDVGRALAILPARDEAPPLLLILSDHGLRFLRLDVNGEASVVDLDLMGAPEPLAPVFTPSVAASAEGPDGSRLVAVSLRRDGLGETRVVILRVD